MSRVRRPAWKCGKQRDRVDHGTLEVLGVVWYGWDLIYGKED